MGQYGGLESLERSWSAERAKLGCNGMRGRGSE